MRGRRGAVRRRVMGAAILAGLAAASSLPGALAQTSGTTTTTTAAAVSTTSTSSTSSTTIAASTTTERPSTSTSTVAEPIPSTVAATTAPPPSLSTSPPEPEALPTGPPPPSLSEASVDAFLDSLVRTPSSSTADLINALRPLQEFGLSAQDVALLGMGRFPIGAEAFYRDDFLEHRSGPPVHGHQGNDIWAAFNAPVRSPADGIVRFEDAGLGGKGAFVTEPDGTYYYLAHLNDFAPGLASGSAVRVGQLIGFNGDTGNARGGPPHVHFEIHPKGGAAVNPKPILDKWVSDALANVPALLAPYLGGAGNSRPLTAVGLVRHFDGGLLSGPARAADDDPQAEQIAAQVRAEALVGPLTPAVLRDHEARRTG